MQRFCLLLLLLFPLNVRGDVVVHFVGGTAPGQFALVDGLLTSLGIGNLNVGSETTALTFEVPGVSGTTDLTFTYQFDGGSFNFAFGFYPVSAVSADPVTDKINYATQALTAATTVFDDNAVNPGAMAGPYSLTPGTELGFFIVPNDTVANFLADPASYYVDLTKRAPLFSATDANPGELDQMLSFVGNNVTLFTFEDLTRTGPSDQDFEDIAFTIDVALNPVVNDPPDCSAAVLSATGCWPPNHKYTLVGIAGVTDPDGDPVTITVTGITQDEPVKSTGRGSGSTCPDAVLVDTDGDETADAAGLRCERDGTGDGRVYSVQFTAADPSGAQCEGSLTFCVVHDQRPGATCVDSGQAYDSTVCPGGGGGGESGAGIVSFDEFNTLTPLPLFLRGDTNFDEVIDISDGIYTLVYLFSGGWPLPCPDASDANDDGEVDLSDAVRVFSYLFGGGFAPPPPTVVVGEDPTVDDVNCD